jgi:uncharacterized protein (DUF1330 family)
MKAYCLFDNLRVHDPAKLEMYKARVAPTVEQFGGRYVVLGGQSAVVEGDWTPTYLVMLEFPDYEAATRWYHSEEYRELKSLRQSAATSNGVIIEGL